MASKKPQRSKGGSEAKGDPPKRSRRKGQPARAARASEDREASLAKWKEYFRWFVEACDANLSELLRARGFAGPEVEATTGDGPHNPPACYVRYKGETANLTFETNYNNEVVPVVVSGSPPRPTGLHWYMAELAPSEAPSMATTYVALRPEDALARFNMYAKFLHEHIDDVLSADEAFMDRIAARIQAVMSR